MRHWRPGVKEVERRKRRRGEGGEMRREGGETGSNLDSGLATLLITRRQAPT